MVERLVVPGASSLSLRRSSCCSVADSGEPHGLQEKRVKDRSVALSPSLALTSPASRPRLPLGEWDLELTDL